MEIRLLDEGLRAIASAERIRSLLWRRNRRGNGSVELRCMTVAEPLLGRARYLYRTDTGEGAVIASFTEEGNETVLLGYEMGHLLSLRRLPAPLPAAQRADRAVLAAISEGFSGDRALRGLRVADTLPESGAPFLGSESGVDLNTLAATHLLGEGKRIRVTLSGDEILCTLTERRDRSTERGFVGQIAEEAVGLWRNRLPVMRALVKGVDDGGEELLLTVEHEDRAQGGFSSCFFDEIAVDGSEIKRRWRDEEGVLHERSEAEYRALLIHLAREAMERHRGEQRLTLTLRGEPDPAHSAAALAHVIGDTVRISDEARGIGVVGVALETEERLRPGEKTVRLTVGIST